MDQPAAPPPLRTRRALILLLLVILLACAALAVIIFYLARPQLTGLFPSGTATPPCVESRLAAGSAIYHIQPAPAGSGSATPAIPPEPELVYWLAGDSPSYTLVFNPDRQNQVFLGTLTAGTPLSVNWEDCRAGIYNVEKVEVRPSFDPAQVDPKLVGVTLYLPLDGTGRGLVVTARLVQLSQPPAAQSTLAVGPQPAPTLQPQAPPGDQPALLLPAPECPGPALALGDQALSIEGGAASAQQVFSLQNADLAPGGGLPQPPQSPGLAYLLSGAGPRLVFLLGAAPGLDPAGLGSFTQALLIAGDCSAALYQLAAPQPLDLSAPGLLDSLPGELVILVPGGEGQAGYALLGAPSGELIVPPAAAPPAQGELQAEIGLLEVKASLDGASIQVLLSIYNFGADPLPVTVNDLLLTVDGTSLPPSSAQPALPLQIAPGQTLELALSFLRPAQGWGVLRVFSIEYDLADFVE